MELGPYEKIAFLPPDPLAQRVGSGHFFSTKIYKDHINIFLSKLGYSELVQRIFEKMTVFLVDPLVCRRRCHLRSSAAAFAAHAATRHRRTVSIATFS